VEFLAGFVEIACKNVVLEVHFCSKSWQKRRSTTKWTIIAGVAGLELGASIAE
jgi:hypothetical protein